MSKTILHLEDVEKWRVYVKTLFSEGYRVLQVKEADEVVLILEKESVDLAIIDHLVPGEKLETGADAIKYMKKHFPEIPIVLFSGAWERTEYKDRDRVKKQTGAVVVVFKVKEDPVKDDLKEQVETLIKE